MNVTLGPIFVASLRKESPMTFIAVRCLHCQSDQIVKRGKTARGTQRYLCQNTRCTKRGFLAQPPSCHAGHERGHLKYRIIQVKLENEYGATRT